jgi:hypothetical protein
MSGSGYGKRHASSADAPAILLRERDHVSTRSMADGAPERSASCVVVTALVFDYVLAAGMSASRTRLLPRMVSKVLVNGVAE